METKVISEAVSSPLSIASLTTGEPASGSLKSAVIVTIWPFVKTLSVSEYDKAPVGLVLSTSKVLLVVSALSNALPPMSTPFDSVIVTGSKFPPGVTSE